ncbi:hypothetical protein BH10BAC2_BH10BAC2_50190 [soil metagenome]
MARFFYFMASPVASHTFKFGTRMSKFTVSHVSKFTGYLNAAKLVNT